MQSLYDKILEILRSGQKAALCTIASTKGSTPLKTGAKMIVWEDGKIFGSVGGGKLEQVTIENAIGVIKAKSPRLFKHELLKELQMACGGLVEMYIEPLMTKKKLFIFGAGHVGKAVVKHTSNLDFDIEVLDPREEMFSEWPEQGYRKVCDDYDKILSSLQTDEESFIVIVTFEHALDRQVLAACIRKPHLYIGMIGSSSKVAKTRQLLLQEGIASEEELDRVDMPIGLDIHAESADEIAISIVAKMIQIKNSPR